MTARKTMSALPQPISSLRNNFALLQRPLFLLAGLALVISSASLKPIIAGDGWEYTYTLQAFFDHGTPDFRPSEVDALAPILDANGLDHITPYHPGLKYNFFESKSGRLYGVHFWLYPLLVLPAKLLLSLSGANQLAAFQVTNAALLIIALYVVFFRNSAPPHKRLMLASLAAVSPVVWYVKWQHPEVFTWACVVISLVEINNRRYIWAAVFASLGAMQNPPLLFFAIFIVALSARERNLKLTLLTAGGALLSFIPSAFNLLNFGRLNLIVALNGTDPSLISLRRTWGFLTDLNQGMLPYVPLLLILTAVAMYRVVVTRSLSGAGALIILATMILSCEPSVNWNSGVALIMRYAIWMIPIFAWLVSEFLPQRPFLRWSVVAAVALHAAIVIQHDGSPYHLYQTPLAARVLTSLPAFYNPEPEVFAERQIHRDRGWPYRDHNWLHRSDGWPHLLPIPFTTQTGSVTKLLVNAASLHRINDLFSVDAVYFQQALTQNSTRDGLFYLNPPRGAVVAYSAPDASHFRSSLRLGASGLPATVNAPMVTIEVKVENVGDVVVWSMGSVPRYDFTISYHTLREGQMVAWEGVRTEVPYALAPGERASVDVMIKLPQAAGRYTLEVLPVYEGLTWGETPLRLSVNVSDDSEAGYTAEITAP